MESLNRRDVERVGQVIANRVEQLLDAFVFQRAAAEHRHNFVFDRGAAKHAFEIAKRDLELRGAGNILGREQSGVMNRIGWNLYFQYLSDSLETMTTA